LIIGNPESEHIKGLAKHTAEHFDVDVIARDAKIRGNYDVCSLHCINSGVINNIKKIEKSCKRVVTRIWGSEFLRVSDKERNNQRKVYSVSENIAFSNPEILKAFDEYYAHEYSKKLVICRFGIEPLGVLRNLKMTRKEAKRYYSLPETRLVVAIGYNASIGQNHLSIIKSISKRGLPELVHFVVPMTYGRKQDYVNSVIKLLDEEGFDYTLLEERMNPTEAAIFRKASDIMIQVQTTDVLSGSMLEHLYADNIVITGDWLPYKVLDDNGIFMLKVSYVSQVGEMLTFAINNYEELCKENKDSKEFIWGLASWEANLKSWINLYKGG